LRPRAAEIGANVGHLVRPAVHDDGDALVGLAREYDLAGIDSVCNPRYRDLIARRGRLLVATHDGVVVGFGGMVDLAHASMVTDLFVTADHHGHGTGRALLDGLLCDRPHRMTGSSSHPAARALYESFGMSLHWWLRYLRVDAVATDAAASIDVATDTADASISDRPELDALADNLVWLRLIRGGVSVGHALTAPPTDAATPWQVFRLRTSLPHDAAIRAVLAALPVGAAVECCIPEWSAAAPALGDLGAVEFDRDVFMSNLPPDADGTPRDLAVVNPGLA
jgi:GNAT superfamily N-acetyltransferase